MLPDLRITEHETLIECNLVSLKLCKIITCAILQHSLKEIKWHQYTSKNCVKIIKSHFKNKTFPRRLKIVDKEIVPHLGDLRKGTGRCSHLLTKSCAGGRIIALLRYKNPLFCIGQSSSELILAVWPQWLVVAIVCCLAVFWKALKTTQTRLAFYQDLNASSLRKSPPLSHSLGHSGLL